MNSKTSYQGESSVRLSRIPLKIGRATPERKRASFITPDKSSKSPVRAQSRQSEQRNDRASGQSSAQAREKERILEELKLLKQRESQLKEELALTTKKGSAIQFKSLGNIIQKTYGRQNSPLNSIGKLAVGRNAEPDDRSRSNAQTRPAKKISLDVGRTIETDRSLENGTGYRLRSFLNKSSLKTQTDSHTVVALELKTQQAKPPELSSSQTRVAMSSKLKEDLRTFQKKLSREDSAGKENSKKQMFISLKRLELNINCGNPMPAKQSKKCKPKPSLGPEASPADTAGLRPAKQAVTRKPLPVQPGPPLPPKRSGRIKLPQTASLIGPHPLGASSTPKHQASSSVLVSSSAKPSEPSHKHSPYVALRKELDRVRHNHHM